MNGAVEWTNFASCAMQEISALLGRLKRNIFMFHRRVYANHSSHVTKSRLAQKGKAYNCDVRLNIGNRLNPIDRRARRVSSFVIVVYYNSILLCLSTPFKLIAPSNKLSILSNRYSIVNSQKEFRIYTSFFC